MFSYVIEEKNTNQPDIFNSEQICKEVLVQKKYECPFLLGGIPILPKELCGKVVCIEHNHELAQYLKGHANPSRLKSEEKEIVAKFAEITTPRHVFSSLKPAKYYKYFKYL